MGWTWVNRLTNYNSKDRSMLVKSLTFPQFQKKIQFWMRFVWENFYNYEFQIITIKDYWLLKGRKGQIKRDKGRYLLYYPCNVSKCFFISGFPSFATTLQIVDFTPCSRSCWTSGLENAFQFLQISYNWSSEAFKNV